MFSIASAAGTDQFGSAFSEGIHFKDPVDANTYSISGYRQTSTSTQTVGSTTATALTGISIPLAAGTYKYRAVVPFTGVAANDAYVVIGYSGTGSIAGIVRYMGLAAGVNTKAQTAFSNSGLNSAALVAADSYSAELDGTMTITGSGNLTISLASSANANTFTLITGSFLEVSKV
jgi:hypothetical protein